jgi:hypothetical protein
MATEKISSAHWALKRLPEESLMKNPMKIFRKASKEIHKRYLNKPPHKHPRKVFLEPSCNHPRRTLKKFLRNHSNIAFISQGRVRPR